MNFLSEFLIVILILLYFLYKKINKIFNFFAEKKIPYEKPWYMLLEMVFKKKSMLDALIDVYNKNKHNKVYGMFEISFPQFIINDPELIKQITVKDFDYFVNHRLIIDPNDEPVIANSLFGLQDQKWKDMRATLSPAFTGSKMRLMFQLIIECCNIAVKHLKEQNLNEPNGIEMEMKDFFTRFTNDVIASTAFGLKVDSLSEKNNEFYMKGRKITNFSSWLILKMFLMANFRPILKYFKLRLFDKNFTNYFMRLVFDTMNYRSENNIVRPDMINLLMEAQKATNNKWSNEDIVAQCFLFFIAGFESTSNVICFTAHEIMENEEVKEKLLTEIDSVNEKLEGKTLTYEILQDMKYMDMVISETLRKWPAAPTTDRVCNKVYDLKYDDKMVTINVGDTLSVNIVGSHYDENNFPNPKKFDPERFNNENKHNIKPYTYLPFGMGPRNCIGNRFALMEIKAILFSILTHFTIEASEKSCIPLELPPRSLLMKPKNGFWVKFCPRSNQFTQ